MSETIVAVGCTWHKDVPRGAKGVRFDKPRKEWVWFAGTEPRQPKKERADETDE